MTRNKIIWKIVIIHVLIYLAVFCLHSCGLLKNTSKEKNSAVQESEKRLEMKELDLSKVYRESNIYSYRPDGTVAEFEQRREEISAATITEIEASEQEKHKRSQVQKQSRPAQLWIAGVLSILLALGYYLIAKRL